MLQPIVFVLASQRRLEDWTCRTERTDYEDFVSRNLVVPPSRSQNFCKSFSRAVHAVVLIRSSRLKYTDLQQHLQPGKTTYKNSVPHQLQLELQLQLYFIRLLVTIDWPAKIAIANLGGPVKRKIN